MASLWRKLSRSRWDSSDPERNPAPLPLNPQSPSVGVGPSRAGTSLAIQSAHAALNEKAREGALVSSSLAKRMTDISPGNSLVKGGHRRTQTMGGGSVRDLSFMIESGRESFSPTPKASPEKRSRPSTPYKNKDPFVDNQDENNDRAMVLSPVPGPSLTPIIRPTAIRRPPHSILGENTPPQSATMLALQNMATSSPSPRELPKEPKEPKEPETPLADTTNGSKANAKRLHPQASVDSLSGQILSLTSIATALQKEMNQLSRRSRDNATDLMSLKEATRARDEDIRKSLRDLVSKSHERSSTRDPYGGALLLEDKPKSTSPLAEKTARPFALPRIPSLASFSASLDRESTISPATSYAVDTPAVIALLEKILREMPTKEGQESLESRLSEVAHQLSGTAPAGKVEELLRLVQQGQTQSARPLPTIDAAGNVTRTRNFSFDEESNPMELEFSQQSGPIASRMERLLVERDGRRSSAPAARPSEVLNDDLIKIIRNVKDSVAQGGGLTAEVKALVRELRGEVLGMGRELGRRLDEVGNNHEARDVGGDETARIVEDGLAEMKKHMDNVLREHRRQSAASASSRATAVDYQEIYNAMRTALKDSQAGKKQTPDMSRESTLR